MKLTASKYFLKGRGYLWPIFRQGIDLPRPADHFGIPPPGYERQRGVLLLPHSEALFRAGVQAG